ncbi:MAG: hypothetical protein HXY34_08620 [Candidatus Thorarchaeota archaeon]|nr:hypothetical protein [Candidatus Thorarchaeota archaeon]
MPPFPTPGLVRDLILVTDSAVVFYTLLFSAILLADWYRGPLRKLVDVRLAWSVFMAGMAVNSFSFVMSDFYFLTDPMTLVWIKVGYLAMMTALLGFFFALEKILPYHTRHSFTAVGLAIILATAGAPRELLWVLALAASMTAFAVLALFFHYYVTSTTGRVRSSIRLILAGFLVGFIGYLGRSDFVYATLGESVYVGGAFLLVTGLVLMGLAILGSPALDELDWADQMLELYVIRAGGYLLFHHKFKTTVEVDENLTAAGIAGVGELFKEITQSATGLNALSVGDYHILFSHGHNFDAVLISRKPYRVLLDMVSEFVEKFQLVYGEELLNEAPSQDDFVSASDIVKLVFYG